MLRISLALAGSYAAFATGCDSLEAGRPPEDESAPRLEKLLVVSNNRFLLSDLLDRQPELACSETSPCPVEAPGAPTCVIPPGMTEGTCPRLFSITNTPPAVDPVSNQVRVVWHKLLDTAVADDLGFVQLLDGSGEAVDGMVTYQPSGSPNVSSIPLFFPYGPAVVIDTAAPLLAGAQYTVAIDAARARDGAGRMAESDVNGPIQPSYAFTMEALHVLATNAGPVAPNTVLTFSTNSPIDEGTLTSTGAVTVRTSTGAEVPVLAFAHRGLVTDSATCAAGLNFAQFDLVARGPGGAPKDWSEGTYTIELPGVRGLATAAPLRGDSHGSPFSAEFTVASPRLEPTDPTAREDFVLPASCSP